MCRPHQALSLEDVMASCDTAVEVIVDIEHGSVAVGDGGIEGEKIGRDRRSAGYGMDAPEQTARRLDPHAPVSEQAAPETQRHLAAAGLDGKRQSEVGDDVI